MTYHTIGFLLTIRTKIFWWAKSLVSYNYFLTKIIYAIHDHLGSIILSFILTFLFPFSFFLWDPLVCTYRARLTDGRRRVHMSSTTKSPFLLAFFLSHFRRCLLVARGLWVLVTIPILLLGRPKITASYKSHIEGWYDTSYLLKSHLFTLMICNYDKQ